MFFQDKDHNFPGWEKRSMMKAEEVESYLK